MIILLIKLQFWSANQINCFKVNEIEIIFNVWDTAGVERYNYLTPIYIQNLMVFMLVYDISKKEAFDDIKLIFLINKLSLH